MSMKEKKKQSCPEGSMLVAEVWQPGCIVVDKFDNYYSNLTATNYLTPLGSEDKPDDTEHNPADTEHVFHALGCDEVPCTIFKIKWKWQQVWAWQWAWTAIIDSGMTSAFGTEASKPFFMATGKVLDKVVKMAYRYDMQTMEVTWKS